MTRLAFEHVGCVEECGVTLVIALLAVFELSALELIEIVGVKRVACCPCRPLILIFVTIGGLCGPLGASL